MNDFGDIEPEDSWDADDPVEIGARNLYRRLALLGEIRQVRAGAPVAELLDDIGERLAAVIDRTPRGDLARRELRIAMISEDLATLRSRL